MYRPNLGHRPVRSHSKAIQKQPKYPQLLITDRQLIDIGAQELAIRQGFSDLRKMRQRDLEYLCTRIEESSGILISLSTIKRIMNGQYNRLPQVATLNALSIYLGYADWQDFKAAKQQAAPDPTLAATNHPLGQATNRSEQAISLPSEPADQKRALRRPVLAGAIFVALLVILLSWNYLTRTPAHNRDGGNLPPASATFTARKTTENAIPNTVVFTYDIDHLAGDSFFIQQSWDKHRRVRISRNTHTLTDIYYEPGYHTAKLIAGDKVVKTIGVSIPTDNWFFYSKDSLSASYPNYIRSVEPIHNGILGLEKQDLSGNKIDPQKPQVYLYNWFPSIIATEADNFRLKARIRMTEVRNTACPFVMPEIFCQHHLMYFALTMPGCTGAINAQFGDHLLNGKNNDLSGLAFDVHQWHDIEMQVRQKQVSISIDRKEIITQEYSATAGLITGLGFHSNGLCQVDSIHLTSLDGKSVYPPSSVTVTPTH